MEVSMEALSAAAFFLSAEGISDGATAVGCWKEV